MKTIYVCLAETEYEGEYAEAVYSSLAKARRHRFKGGDKCLIVRFKIDSGKRGKEVTREARVHSWA